MTRKISFGRSKKLNDYGMSLKKKMKQRNPRDMVLHAAKNIQNCENINLKETFTHIYINKRNMST